MLVCSQRAFKIVLESPERDTIYIFPSGNHSGEVSSDEFTYAIGLLLLSQRAILEDRSSLVTTPKTPIQLPRRQQNVTTVEKTAGQPTGLGLKDTARVLFPDDPGSSSTSGGGNVRQIFLLTPEQINEALQPTNVPAAHVSALAESQVADEEQEKEHSDSPKRNQEARPEDMFAEQK